MVLVLDNSNSRAVGGDLRLVELADTRNPDIHILKGKVPRIGKARISSVTKNPHIQQQKTKGTETGTPTVTGTGTGTGGRGGGMYPPPREMRPGVER
jgi:hypothetical protein